MIFVICISQRIIEKVLANCNGLQNNFEKYVFQQTAKLCGNVMKIIPAQ